MLERLKEQLTKLEVQATDKEENKEIALGTSKLNYLDPRISVAWLVNYFIFNKHSTQSGRCKTSNKKLFLEFHFPYLKWKKLQLFFTGKI